jgi:cytochrome c peroxidase
MHNGVFRELATAIKFYNQYIVRNDEVGINPETGQAWGAPEVADNIDFERLRQGHPLDDDRVALLVAFLRTLTDRRFEHLLPTTVQDAVSCLQPAEETCDE